MNNYEEGQFIRIVYGLYFFFVFLCRKSTEKRVN